MRDLLEDCEILGVAPDASLAEIKRAYRDLVKDWHPDRFPDDPQLRSRAEIKIKKINRAYQNLKKNPPQATVAIPEPPPRSAPPQRQPKPKNWRRFEVGRDRLHTVLWHPEEPKTILSASREGTVAATDLDSGRSRICLEAEAGLSAFAVDGSGKVAAGGSTNGTITLWKLATGKEIDSLGGWFFGHSGAVTALHFSRDRKTLISASDDGTTLLWQWKTQKILQTLRLPEGGFSSLALEDSGKLLVTGSEGGLDVWRIRTGQLLRSQTKYARDLRSLAISPDGKAIAVGAGDGAIVLYKFGTLHKLRGLSGHSAAANGLAWSADGRFLASASDDGTARWWEVESGRSRRSLDLDGVELISAIVAPGDRNLVLGSSSGDLYIWDLQ